MVRFVCIGLTAGLLLAASSLIMAGEILLLGSPLERSVIREKILRPNGIRHKDSAGWVAPGDYGQYAESCWSTGTNPRANGPRRAISMRCASISRTAGPSFSEAMPS